MYSLRNAAMARDTWSGFPCAWRTSCPNKTSRTSHRSVWVGECIPAARDCNTRWQPRIRDVLRQRSSAVRGIREKERHLGGSRAFRKFLRHLRLILKTNTCRCDVRVVDVSVLCRWSMPNSSFFDAPLRTIRCSLPTAPRPLRLLN